MIFMSLELTYFLASPLQSEQTASFCTKMMDGPLFFALTTDLL